MKNFPHSLLRRTLAAAVCSLAVAGASAQVQYLTVNRADGSQVSFALAEDPVVTNSATELTVSSSSTTITVPFAELKNYVFSTTITSVKPVTVQPSHRIDEGSIIFAGLHPGQNIDIFTPDGRQVSHHTADASGNALVDISTLGRGVYIVNTAACSFKFMKK
ncbi:MAG: hypothetical protein SPL53_08740 [Bacteroidales bacterium]|nr:hypothetical protein [Bacteroidales bacterium]